jgi:hypothetical protein
MKPHPKALDAYRSIEHLRTFDELRLAINLDLVDGVCAVGPINTGVYANNDRGFMVVYATEDVIEIRTGDVSFVSIEDIHEDPPAG